MIYVAGTIRIKSSRDYETELKIGGIDKRMKKGFFICIEGLDKSGKTTQSTPLSPAMGRLEDSYVSISLIEGSVYMR